MARKNLELKAFQEEPFTVIGTDGELLGEVQHGLSASQQIEIYRYMVRTRLVDERALIMQKQGKIAFYASSAGQECTQVATAYALQEGDWVFPSHREQGVFLTRGMTLEEVLGHFMSRVADPAKGRQMPGHLGTIRRRLVHLSSPVGTQIPQAVGCAMASRYKGTSEVTMVYFGDGGTSEGDFHEGMNFAGVYRAPIVFICVNNQWAISVPTSIQTASKTFAQKACAYGFEGYKVDGNDPLATYYAAKMAVDRARQGGGPTLIECVTYRYAPHSSADDDKRYRPEAEIAEWKEKRDPIRRTRAYLIKEGILTEPQEADIIQEEKALVIDTLREVEAMPHPPLASFLEEVYAEEPWFLKEEKEKVLSLYGNLYRPEGE
ncbi:MAG: thiamine pyrophosphate-dependent dehydrogenase E1 component subunit alpha [bacterium JZ-2024 1]